MRDILPAGFRRGWLFLHLTWAGAGAIAQAPNPTSAANPFYGSVTAQPLSDETLKLSLDDAVSRGLKNNLGLKEAENDERIVHADKSEALQEFLPTITLKGDIGIHQHDLAAQGFGPGVVSKFAGVFPGGSMPAGISLITKDDLTEGQLQFSEILFSGPVIAGWKAAGSSAKAAHFAKMARGARWCSRWPRLICTRLPHRAKWTTPRRWLAEDQLMLDHAHAAHEAGSHRIWTNCGRACS